MKKKLFVFGLTALSILAVNTTVSAQTGHSPTIGSFTVPGQGIKVTHTMLQQSTSGTVTFKLTNVSGRTLEGGKSFLLTLPPQDGLSYDLSTLSGVRQLPLGVGAVPTLRLNTSANSTLAFTCKLVKTALPQPVSQQIFLRIN